MGARIMELRPELQEFAEEMERVLRNNDYKSGWDSISIHELFERVKDEFEELQRDYIKMNNAIDGAELIQRMGHEAIDIANFCMFLHNHTQKGSE